MKEIGLAIILLLLLAVMGGCADKPLGEDRVIRVAVSIPPQAWLVRQIGGPRVDAVALVEPGQSPATYQPTDIQISHLARCDVYFRIGVPFEYGHWLRPLEESSRLRIVDMRQGIELRAMEGRPADAAPQRTDGDDQRYHGRDPHIWLSPRLLKVQARLVADVLSQIDPASERAYRLNLQELDAALDALDQDIRAKLQPYQGRALLVFHPAWGYFAAEYGLRQISVEVEGKEPTDQELTQLLRVAERERIRVVLVQRQITGRGADTVAQAIGGRVEQVDPLAADVIANLRHVADAVVASYQGT